MKLQIEYPRMLFTRELSTDQKFRCMIISILNLYGQIINITILDCR